MDEPIVDVALATHNSERFLEALLDSLLVQSYRNIRLVIIDDGSTDRTLDILARYGAKYPEKFVLMEHVVSPRGPKETFSRITEKCSAGYLMYCDHDDVWLPDKIRISIEAIQRLERNLGSHHPILVHTDLAVVDQDLAIIHPSYTACNNIDPNQRGLCRVILTNIAPGCAMIVNRALYELATPVPVGAHMHDWWLVLVAAAFGHIEYIPTPTILYRQHSSNLVGAPRRDVILWMKKLVRGLVGPNMFNTTVVQAQAFQDRFGDQLRGYDFDVVRAVANTFHVPRIMRPIQFIHLDLRRATLKKTVLMFAVLLLAPRVRADDAPSR